MRQGERIDGRSMEQARDAQVQPVPCENVTWLEVQALNVDRLDADQSDERASIERLAES